MLCLFSSLLSPSLIWFCSFACCYFTKYALKPPCFSFFLLFACQSMFMFPLSFSSSSSISSIPPSLDTISELERALSDISEDEVYPEDHTAPDNSWILPTNLTSLSDFDHFTSPTPSSQSSQIPCDLEHSETGEHNGLETNKSRWFCLKQRIKYFYYLLCFLVLMAKKMHIMSQVLAVLARKVLTPNICEATEKVKSFAIAKLNTANIHMSKKYFALKWQMLITYLTYHLPLKLLTWVSTLPWVQTRLHLPALTSSTLAPVVYSLPPSASTILTSQLSSYFLLSRSAMSPTLLTASLHQYLLNPSPFFLPVLLVVFLLVVMLTASQSLVLALILATPLGLTLFYMESVIPRQRRAVLPMFMTENTIEYDESPFSSSLNMQEYSTTQLIQHTWTSDMCDPAA